MLKCPEVSSVPDQMNQIVLVDCNQQVQSDSCVKVVLAFFWLIFLNLIKDLNFLKNQDPLENSSNVYVENYDLRANSYLCLT